MDDTSARFRKAYQYVIDDEAEAERQEALDEQEQEDLIKKLHTENLAKNELYTKLFLALPLLSMLPYITTLFSPTTSLLSILSISSLLMSAYILFYFPHNRTGLTWLDELNKPKTTSSASKLPKLGEVVDRGPIELYLATLNGVLVMLLAIAGAVMRSDRGFHGFGVLPGLIFAVILVAKVVMAGVDVGQLEGLKYAYKGA